MKEWEYSAKTAYRNVRTVEHYERDRFSGLLGKYRYKIEQRGVKAIINQLPQGISVLDCPCGTGRWWEALKEKASSIIGMDVSETMLAFARRTQENCSVPVTIVKGDAEAIDLPDGHVDYVFSHALTKHLPIPVQYRVLSEFARVAREGVVCSFGIFNHITYEFWRRRRLIESYPVFPEELEWMAQAAGLVIAKRKRCTTRLGVEYTVLFRKMG